jgi:hypothetical protein
MTMHFAASLDVRPGGGNIEDFGTSLPGFFILMPNKLAPTRDAYKLGLMLLFPNG